VKLPNCPRTSPFPGGRSRLVMIEPSAKTIRYLIETDGRVGQTGWEDV